MPPIQYCMLDGSIASLPMLNIRSIGAVVFPSSEQLISVHYLAFQI